MAMTIQCDIASAEQEIFSGSVELLVATGDLGEVGINYGHAPLLTSLRPGPIRIIKNDGEEEIIYVSGGFLEVQPNLVTVLADTALRGEDMDEEAALAAQKEAEAALEGASDDVDYQAATAQLAAAVAQLRTLQQIRKNLK